MGDELTVVQGWKSRICLRHRPWCGRLLLGRIPQLYALLAASNGGRAALSFKVPSNAVCLHDAQVFSCSSLTVEDMCNSEQRVVLGLHLSSPVSVRGAQLWMTACKNGACLQ